MGGAQEAAPGGCRSQGQAAWGICKQRNREPRTQDKDRGRPGEAPSVSPPPRHCRHDRCWLRPYPLISAKAPSEASLRIPGGRDPGFGGGGRDPAKAPMSDFLGILLFFSGTVTSPSPLLSMAPPPTSSLPGLRFVSETGLMPQLWSFKTVALSATCENPWYQCGIHP